MKAVEEFYSMESAFIDVEMDVPLFEVGRAGLPDNRFRVQAFHFLPGCKSDAFAVRFRNDEQKIEMVVLRFLIDLEHDTSDNPAIFPDAVGNAIINTAFYGCAGDTVSLMFSTTVPT